MLSLAFDTTQQACSAAVAYDGKIVSHSYKQMLRGHAEELVPMLNRVLQEGKIEFKNLNFIAVTVGPGTFTGVRVGLAAARALALVHNIPLLGVGTLELLAQTAVNSYMSGVLPDEGIIAAIDARRGEIYTQSFDSLGEPLDAPTIGKASAVLPNKSLRTGVIIGSGAKDLHNFMPKWRVNSKILQPDARPLALIAQNWHQRASRVPPSPVYLRSPDARLPSKTAT